jgi:UDP-glucuronate 4-epimerase
VSLPAAIRDSREALRKARGRFTPGERISLFVARYLVTGAAGFIAARVCEMLAEAGHEVVGVDNMDDAYDVRLKDWRLDRLRRLEGFAFRRMDIGTERSEIHELFGEYRKKGSPCFEGVINLAARAGVRQSVENPWVYINTNITGTVNLLESCRLFEVKKFVLASTSSLYGKENPLPFREDANTDHVLSPYAASKKGAEALCYTYHHLYGIDTAIPRYFTVYGPAGRPDMSLFRFVQWVSEGRPVLVYGDGSQSRDFTFVDDIARGTIACLGLQGYNVINLGSDSPIVLLDALRQVEKWTGKTAIIDWRERHAADVMGTWANIGLARRVLRWDPLTSFEQGLGAVVDWYNENRSWAKSIRTT